MGLLEDLKDQASKIQADEENEKAGEAEKEVFYQENLRPGMLQAYQYFIDLVAHINIVKPECIVDYPLMPDGQGTISLNQGDYKVLIDSSSNPKKIDIRFYARLEEPVTLGVDSKIEALRYSDYLDSYRIKYHRRDEKNEQYEVVRSEFQIEGPLPLQLRIFANVDQQRIDIISKNFMRPSLERSSFRPEDMNEKLLDRVGKFILRKEDSISSAQISDQALAGIRKKLESEKAQAEVRRVALEAESESAKKEGGLNFRLKNAVLNQKDKVKNLLGKTIRRGAKKSHADNVD